MEIPKRLPSIVGFQRAGTMTHTFTSESVTEGHPDKVCDYIADSILDAHIEQDPHARVACEVLCKADKVILAGEITSNAHVDYERAVRSAIREIGYIDRDQPFCADSVEVHQFISLQAADIARGVNAETNSDGEQGAGDQGIMFGYASDETAELMPLPILLAHRLAQGLAEDRHNGTQDWLRPDAKTQVSVQYRGITPVRVSDILISTQHASGTAQGCIRGYVQEELAPRVLGQWYQPDIRFVVNPTGVFEQGGPSADCGVTGRKIIVDTYGGAARHGGGAFSGKDPSKVDRSAAYFCRYVSRQLIKAGLAKRVELQIAYAIGRPHPVSVRVDTFGTGNPRDAAGFVRAFDFRPAEIIRRLDLLRPIYRSTTNYGHFGKLGLSWES